MTYVITVSEGVSSLEVSFVDEGINLVEQIKVDGGEDKALSYLPFFVNDLKRNYSHLFPQPVVEPVDMMMGGEE